MEEVHPHASISGNGRLEFADSDDPLLGNDRGRAALCAGALLTAVPEKLPRNPVSLIQIPSTVEEVPAWLDHLVEHGLGVEPDETVDSEYLAAVKECLGSAINIVGVQADVAGLDFHDIPHTLTTLRNLAYVARTVKRAVPSAISSREFCNALLGGAFHDSVIVGSLVEEHLENPTDSTLSQKILKRNITDTHVDIAQLTIDLMGSEDLSAIFAISEMRKTGKFLESDEEFVRWSIRPTAPTFKDDTVVQEGITPDMPFAMRLVAFADVADCGIVIGETNVLKVYNIKNDCLLIETNRSLRDMILKPSLADTLNPAARSGFREQVLIWARQQEPFIQGRSRIFFNQDLSGLSPAIVSIMHTLFSGFEASIQSRKSILEQREKMELKTLLEQLRLNWDANRKIIPHI